MIFLLGAHSGFCENFERKFQVNVIVQCEDLKLQNSIKNSIEGLLGRISEVSLENDNPDYTIKINTLPAKKCSEKLCLTMSVLVLGSYDFRHLKESIVNPISESTLKAINKKRETIISTYLYELEPKDLLPAFEKIVSNLNDGTFEQYREFDRELLRLFVGEREKQK